MKKWTSVRQGKEDCVDALTVDEDDSLILDDSIGGKEMELQPIPIEALKDALEEQTRDLPFKMAEEPELENGDAEQRFTTPEQKLRISTRVRRPPQSFEQFPKWQSKTQRRRRKTWKAQKKSNGKK